MPRLLVRIKKKSDGSAALSCVRSDGSVTWQRQDGRQGTFFPLHDLTHYAVETTLGYRSGFYGLVAEGWDLGDFGAPWPRGPLPAEAGLTELIVGFLDAERASGSRWPASDFNARAAAYLASHGITGSLDLTDDALARVRARRAELFQRWHALPAGETLELEFDLP